MVQDEEVVAKLRDLLQSVDLATTTERQLRKQLEETFGESLSERKAIIREEVQRYLESQAGDSAPADGEAGTAGAAEAAAEAAEHADADVAADAADEEDGAEEEEEEDGTKPSAKGKRRRKSNAGFGSTLSVEMQQFLGVETMPRTEVVKKLWEYIKEHKLQDPSNGRKILLDEKFGRLFTAPLNMFSMNKQLSRHCFTADRGSQELEDEEGYGGGDGALLQPRAKPKPKPRKRAAEGDDGEAPKRKTGFTKELRISPELARWTGRETISRPELTAFFWKYIKEHGLQNPANRGEVLADATLEAITGQKTFKAFGFAKFMTPHIHGYADAA